MKTFLAMVVALATFTACGSAEDAKKSCSAQKQFSSPIVSRGTPSDLAEFKATIKGVSGGGAQDCGSVGVTVDPAQVVNCAMSAAAGQRGFYAVIQQRDEKTKANYWEAWVKTEYPSGVVEPRVLVYRQFSNGSYSVQECVHAQPVTGAIVRRPFDCSSFLDQPQLVQSLTSQARGC